MDTWGEFLKIEEIGLLVAKHNYGKYLKLYNVPVFLFKPYKIPMMARAHVGNNLDKEVFLKLLELSMHWDVPVLDIYTNFKINVSSPIITRDVKYTIIIDLDRTEDEIFMSFSKNTRYCIRKSKSLGVKVEIGNDEEEFHEFWDLYLNLTKRKSIPSEKYAFIKDIFNLKHMSKLFLAKYNGRIIGGSLILINPPLALWKLAAYDIKYKACYPSYLIQWEVMKYLKEVGVRYYDMGGIYGEYGADRGPTKFKMGFSGRVYQYYVYHIHFDPILKILPKFLISLRNNISKIWKR